MNACEAYEELTKRNSRFLSLCSNEADIGPRRRAALANGQQPFATVVTCSDSRVAPEHLFNCGLGELFVVRTAGNTIGPGELASIVYACGHLGCELVVVMGHTGCGAVAAALAGNTTGSVGFVTKRILAAAPTSRDAREVTELNVRAGLAQVAACPEVAPLLGKGLVLRGAIHNIDTGLVEFPEGDGWVYE